MIALLGWRGRLTQFPDVRAHPLSAQLRDGNPPTRRLQADRTPVGDGDEDGNLLADFERHGGGEVGSQRSEVRTRLQQLVMTLRISRLSEMTRNSECCAAVLETQLVWGEYRRASLCRRWPVRCRDPMVRASRGRPMRSVRSSPSWHPPVECDCRIAAAATVRELSPAPHFWRTETGLERGGVPAESIRNPFQSPRCSGVPGFVRERAARANVREPIDLEHFDRGRNCTMKYALESSCLSLFPPSFQKPDSW